MANCRVSDISTIRRNKILCIGAGYVGGPTMAVIAQQCPEIEVYVVDMKSAKIDAWNSHCLPVYEPGLDDIVKVCRGRNLFFSVEVATLIRECDIIFLCVDTPTKTYGQSAGGANIERIESASRDIAMNSTSSKIVIEKSTVPVRTSEIIQTIFESNFTRDASYAILSNPEFLAEGSAIHDLLNADRVLIGGADREAIQVIVDVYTHWIPREKIITSDVWSAELSKLVANAFLAQRISSINSVSAICEKTGGDVMKVALVVGGDKRIGPYFLKASVGFGGSCFKKDLLNLMYLCRMHHLDEVAQYWQSVLDMNTYQKRRFTEIIISSLFSTVASKKLAVLGFAFKKDTDDVRETAAIDICEGLIAEKAYVHFYDPKVSLTVAMREFETQGKSRELDLKKHLIAEATAAAACEGAHAIIVLTEWDEFQLLDFENIFKSMRKPAFVFDGRNILDHDKLTEIGFQVYSLGVSSKVVKKRKQFRFSSPGE